MMNLNYLIDHNFYHIFKIILRISSKKHETTTDNFPTRIHVNKIENRIRSKIKTRHYIELLKPETVKLLGRTKNKIPKVENGENVLPLETTEVVLVSCNIVEHQFD